MSGDVYLHVGTAKSGTTYVQRILAGNRNLLSRHQVLYPGERTSHFLAAVDLRGTGFMGQEYPRARGAWNDIVSEVRAFAGSALISSETLAKVRSELVRKAVDSFSGRDVRIVISCRDLARQLPASWQETVKNRNVGTYDDYLAAVFNSWNGGRTTLRTVFWRIQNLIALAERWAAVVGVENVRLVTVPPAGATPNTLWDRYRQATSLPDLDYRLDASVRNVSLGAAETELLRRLNTYLPEDLSWPEYESRIKNRFVPREMFRGRSGGRLGVPDRYQQPTLQCAGQMIDALRGAGYTVVGDLEELRPDFRTATTLPDDIDTERLLDLSLSVLASISSRQPHAARELSGKEALGLLTGKLRRRLDPRR